MNLNNKNIRIISLLQWILVSYIIYYFSSQSRIEFVPSEIWNYDKIVHFFVFLFYGFSTGLMLYINLYLKGKLNTILILTLLIGLIFGASDEIHQRFTPGRNSDFFDFLADFLGVLVSVILFRLILNKFKIHFHQKS